MGEGSKVQGSTAPGGRGIVERALSTETVENYLSELKSKYDVGRTITDSPFNSKILRGQRLKGELILEVPVQNAPVPREMIEAAASRGIVIRDIAGNVYR